MTDRPTIPRRRKALYALVVVGGIVGAALFSAHRYSLGLLHPLPPVEPSYPIIESFFDDVRHKAAQVRWPDAEGSKPGARGPEVLLRVRRGTTGAKPFTENGGWFVTMTPDKLPPTRRVLLFGGSTAYGYQLSYDRSLAGQLEAGLRRTTGDDSLRVLNLARPGWELNSLTLLMDRVLRALRRQPPAAVVLMTGNNELFTPILFGVGHHPHEQWPMVQVARQLMLQHGLLRPPPGFDPGYYKKPDWRPIPNWIIGLRIYRARRGVPDASHWLAVRRAYLANFNRRLDELQKLTGRLGVPLVLVVPPVNLSLFPGGIQPQPVTFRALGPTAYNTLAGALERALADNDVAELRRMVKAYPDGPLQRYWLAQTLDRAGKHSDAVAHFRRARDDQMGLLGAMPSVGKAVAARRGTAGVTVARARGLYPADRPVLARSRELFLDACHLTAAGTRLLARDVIEQVSAVISEASGSADAPGSGHPPATTPADPANGTAASTPPSP